VRISLLVHNVYGVGGTNRTVINLAEELSHRHSVEIVSILRRLDRPMLEIPARIPVVGLVDLRKGARDTTDPRLRELSQFVPAEEEFFRFYSRLTDERVGEYLRRTASDVVVGTRSAINLYVARLGRPGTVRVAQEHMTQDMIPESVHEQMRRYYPRLSAVTAVTEADAGAVRTLLGPGAPPVRAIPNSVPEPRVPRADGNSKVVVAAGRLDEIKRYDILVHAFAKVVTERPDWTLRIYGSGGQFRPLAALIADLELHNHVFLMGSYAPIETEWVKGSIAAVTSDQESFGMTIVEAMRCGLPVVSTACPVGPAEIIQDGVDGVLVPTGDIDAVAGALLRLMNDDELRGQLASAAVTNARRYDPSLIAEQYERLFQQEPPARISLHRQAAAGLTGSARRLRTGTHRALTRITPGRALRTGTDANPTADCHLAANQVVVSVHDAALPRHLSDLVLRPRRIEPAPEPVRIPLTGDPAGWQASFPADQGLLDEGRWDLFLADQRGGLHRLRAGLLDVRGLLGGCAETAPFARNIPYRTADGFLAVGAGARPPHSEGVELF
jgi:glycosyltransferase involved in cell wall biosynthesis